MKNSDAWPQNAGRRCRRENCSAGPSTGFLIGGRAQHRRLGTGDLPRLLSDGTAGAFPSDVEGFGMAVVEQLAAGLPTVAYDAPGPRDILGNLPQLLVPAGDATGFGEAISAILTADLAHYRELSERSVDTARKFSWQDIASETAAEYRKYLHDAYG